MAALLLALPASAAAHSIAPPPLPAAAPFLGEDPPAAQVSAFRDLEPVEAAALAREERRPLVLVFEAAWSAPSRRMETSWRDAAVRGVLAERAVALRLDHDSHLALAERHGVRDLPAVLVLPDGEAVGARLVGFRPPERLALELGEALERSRPSRALLGRLGEEALTDPSARFELARALLNESTPAADAEALEHLLWCFDNGARHSAFAHLRSGPVVLRLGHLATRLPEAREALRTRRDRLRSAVEQGVATGGEIEDFAALSRALGERAPALALYDRLGTAGHPGARLRPALGQALLEELLAAGRDRDALQVVGDPLARVEQRMETQRRAALHPVPGAEQVQAHARELVVLEGLRWFGPLIATERRTDALALADRLLAFDPSGRTAARLVDIAAARNAPSLAREVGRRAATHLPAAERAALDEALTRLGPQAGVSPASSPASSPARDR